MLSGKAGWFPLDPRTKLIALLVVNYLAFGRGSLLAPMLAFVWASFLLTNAMTLSVWIRYVLSVPAMAILALWVPGVIDHPIILIIGVIAYWFARFTISIGMAYYVVKTTKVSEFIAALRSWRIPQVLVVPIAVMLRFIPTVIHELQAIVDAMRLRGVVGNGWQMATHPIQTAEYVVVPLLATTTRISDDLTASSMLRGLGRNGVRTCVTPIGFTYRDGICLVVVMGLLVIHFLNIPL